MKTAAPKASRRRLPGLNRRVLRFLCHSLLFHIGLLGIADILLNFYLVSIGFEGGTIAVVQALPRLSGFLVGLPIGLLANRIGNRRLIIASTAGLALSVAATAFTADLAVIGCSRFVWGACFGANQVAKPPFMVTLTARGEHTAQFSWHNLVSMLAVAAGSVLGGALPLLMSEALAIGGPGAHELPLAYRASIFCAAGLLLASVLPLLGLRAGNGASDDGRHTGGPAGEPVAFRSVLRLTLPLLVFGVSGGLTFPFFNLIFRELFGISDSAIGGVIGFGWLVMGGAPLLNPVWEARWGRAGALLGLMIASALAFVGFGLSRTLLLAVGFYVIAIGLRNTMQPLFQPLLLDAIPAAQHNLASSVGLALWNIGWFASTLSFGWLGAAVGYRGIMLIVALFVVLNGVAIRVTAPRR